ncbi:MAG TPA: hypothetical protein DCY17_06155 [Clostridiales bacterium]|nr:hypothetical protein [Clostridiales bacterium]
MDDFQVLRPHHAFCILNYRQRGYSDEFIDNMNTIVRKLKPDADIKIVQASDVVCIACPNRTEPQSSDDVCCRCAEKVKRYDSAAMRLLEVEPGTVLKWGALSEKAKYIMADALLFETVCGDCEWHEICHSAHSDTAVEHQPV